MAGRSLHLQPDSPAVTSDPLFPAALQVRRKSRGTLKGSTLLETVLLGGDGRDGRGGEEQAPPAKPALRPQAAEGLGGPARLLGHPASLPSSRASARSLTPAAAASTENPCPHPCVPGFRRGGESVKSMLSSSGKS